MKIEETWYDVEDGTQYYNIKDITVWDLQAIMSLLEAEMARGKITHLSHIECSKLMEEIKKQKIPKF